MSRTDRRDRNTCPAGIAVVSGAAGGAHVTLGYILRRPAQLVAPAGGRPVLMLTVEPVTSVRESHPPA